MNPSFRLSIIFVAVTLLLSADECKLWDFKATSAGNLDTLIDLAMWNGGTEQQCESMRKRVQQSLKHRLDAAHQHAQELFDRDLKNTTSSKPRSAQDILRDGEETAQANRAETQARRAWTDLPQCTCVARGETESEKRKREDRAQQAAEDAKRKAKSVADRDNQRQKDESDLAKRAAARTEWELREAKRKEDQAQKEHEIEARLNAAHDELTRRRLLLEQDAALARIARERAADPAPSLAPGAQKSDSSNTEAVDQRSSVGESILAEMKSDPFGRGGKAAIQSNSGPRTPDDPTMWTDPFERHRDETKEKVFTAAAKVFEEAAKKAAQILADDASQASARLSPKKAAAYIRETNDVKSFMKGFEAVFKYYDRAIGVAKIAGAETSDDRSRASWELGINLAQSAAKGGATWAVEMLPKRVASVLLGPVAWGGSIVLGSENTQIEPSDVLQRPQEFSSEDKKEVLYRQAQAYAKHGDNWSEIQRAELVNLALLVKNKR